MSICNLTRIIPSNQCIGDSLRTINANFSALDAGICNVPLVVSDNNITISTGSDRYQRPIVQIATETPVIYQTQFTYKSSRVEPITIGGFEDESECQAYLFPYSSNWMLPRPYASFEVASNGSGYPQITLYWMTSASNASTVFATNSAISTRFNDSITALYKEQNKLYVGGNFTTINGIDTNKFAIIDIQNGFYDNDNGFCGTLAYNPLSGISKNLGTVGTVNCIAKQTINTFPLLILGGTFDSVTLGKGLVIYNETLDLFYSFYVNGTVNSFIVEGTELFVVGDFDYINYGVTPATIGSKQRVYCNGLAKISLSMLVSSPLLSIDTEFAANVIKTFTSPAILNCIAIQTGYLYVGGDFQLQNNSGEIISKNIALFESATGIFNEGWLYIVNRPILTMYIDNPASILYVGGEFTTVISHRDLYILKKQITETHTYHHAVAFTLKLPQLPGILPLWKPRFNNTVNKFVAHDNELQTHLYATGQFTEINDNAVGYIGAVTKATEFVTYGATGRFVPWNLYLSTAPTKNTNALVKTVGEQVSTLFVGGTFTQVNGIERRFLANVAGVGENTTTTPPSIVVFEAGGHIISQNQKFSHDFKTGVRSITEAAPYGCVNKCTFPPIKNGFKGITKNQLCRFYVRRPGNAPQNGIFSATDDLNKNDAYILGWTVNFDSQKDI